MFHDEAATRAIERFQTLCHGPRMAAHNQPIFCRLCRGLGSYEFTLTVLRKYPVDYYRCGECGSLQTELPHWLDEAYSSNLNNLDTGAAHRNLDSLAVSMTVSNLLDLHNMVDIGGGDGLLCRLLRDHGKNAYVSDSYALPVYAQGFTKPNFDRPDMLTAFEVFEHFAEPAEEIDKLFVQRPLLVLIMTTPYKGQGADWDYLIPGTGHHIFFYSEKAFKIIADRYDYDIFRARDYTLFYKKNLITTLKKRVLRFRLHPRMIRLYRALLGYRLDDGYVRDASFIAEREI